MGVGRKEIELHMPRFFAVWRALLQRIRISQALLWRRTWHEVVGSPRRGWRQESTTSASCSSCWVIGDTPSRCPVQNQDDRNGPGRRDPVCFRGYVARCTPPPPLCSVHCHNATHPHSNTSVLQLTTTQVSMLVSCQNSLFHDAATADRTERRIEPGANRCITNSVCAFMRYEFLLDRECRLWHWKVTRRTLLCGEGRKPRSPRCGDLPQS